MSLNVLIVDDHEMFARGLEMILRGFTDCGIHTIDIATNATDVQKTLKQKAFDLVFLDIRMPEKSGEAILKDITFRYPACKVIVVSMISDEKTVMRLVREGVNAYVYKNTSPDELHHTVREVMRHGYYFSPAVAAYMARHVKFPELMQEPLSDKESQVLQLLCEGYSYKDIADKVFLSQRTIEGYKTKLMEKTGSASTAALVVYAIREGYYHV